jgi:GT2 family glycosyltransferase
VTSPTLKVLLISGPSATGKTHYALRLSLRYRVATESMDRLYRLALAAAGIPFGKRDEGDSRAAGDTVSIYKAAHALRTEGEFSPETVAKFFSHLDLAIRQSLELANALGLAMVFEGYTLKFPDEASRVVAAAKEVVGDDFHLVRAILRPPRKAWQKLRATKREGQGRPAPDSVKKEDYQRRMAPPATAEGVIDFFVSDDDDFRRLTDDLLGLQRQEMSTAGLGLIASVERRDTQAGRERIRAVEHDRLIAELLGRLRGERDERLHAIEAEMEVLEKQAGELSFLLEERRAEVSRLERERREAEVKLGDRDRALERATDEVTAGAREQRRLQEQLERRIETLAAVTRDVERAAGSRSWRLGHGVGRLLRTLTFRRPKTEGALEVALERLRKLESPERGAAAPELPPPVAVEKPKPSTETPKRVDRPAKASPTRPKSRRGPPPAVGPTSASKPTEAAARQAFLSRYERALGPPDPLPDALATSSIPLPLDHRAILRRREEVGDSANTVDVIIPVHDSLTELHRCLWSLLGKTGHPFHLILVNDGSDEQTTQYLGDFAARNEGVTLIHDPLPPHGYALAANIGLRASKSDYTVLLPTGTVVTFGWLERIISCAASDEQLGVVGPVSGVADRAADPPDGNGSSVLTSLPGWLTPDGMGLLVSSLSEGARPRVPVVDGSCYAIKRAVIEAIGFFDAERFAEGHSEDIDFSRRAAQAGFELAIADDAYVHRAKPRTGDSNGSRPLVEAHRRALLSKHGEAEIRGQADALDANGPLSRLHAAVKTLTADTSKVEQGVRAILKQPLGVSYLLSGISERSAEGIESIGDAVNGMRALGIPATIGVPARDLDQARKSYPAAADAFVSFSDRQELSGRTADADVIVATDFKSVAMVKELRRGREDFLAAYHLQDYEPFFAETRSETPGEAEASYTAIEGQILLADTHWLCGLVGRLHGLHVSKVEPNIDPSLVGFKRPKARESAPVRVAAMIRPGVERSQPLMTLGLLRRLKHELASQVEIVTFGGELAELTRGEKTDLGWIEQPGAIGRSDLGEALGTSDVLLDCSVYQALGRTNLEAMACGCTAILPQLGGAREFAVDGVNALMVDTTDEDATYRALADLATDPERLHRLQANAAEAAGRFNPTRAALSVYALFEYEHSRLRGDAPATLERQGSGSD